MSTLPPPPPTPPPTDDARPLDALPTGGAPPALHDGGEPNVADRLASYGKNQFRHHGGQGRERARDWERSSPDLADDEIEIEIEIEDEDPTATPSSGYRPRET